jgi:hypothetical protein
MRKAVPERVGFAAGRTGGWLLAALVLAAGCGGDALGRRAITGKVMLDGQPIKRGSIRFEPLAKTGVAGGGVIVDGAYRVPAERGLSPGKYRVSISAPKTDATAPPTMENEGPPAEEQVPPRYNSQSDLQIEIEPSGKTEFDFDLKTQSP